MPQKSTLNKQNKNVTSWTAFFLMKKAVLFETFCKYTQFVCYFLQLLQIREAQNIIFIFSMWWWTQQHILGRGLIMGGEIIWS